MPMERKQSLRMFSPVILFHDHQYIKDESTNHSHLPYSDPFHQDDQTIKLHKRRVSQMLESNGRYWSDIITWSRDHAMTIEHSPVPSLVSSPTPPLQSQELPSPPSPSPPPPSNYSRRQPQQQRRHSHQKSNTTAGSAVLVTTSTTATTITPCGKTTKRRRGNLPKAVTAILRDWLSDHKKHPYPSEDEKDALASQTGLTLNQISNWFINARRRILQPMLEQEEVDQHQNELDILPYENPSHHHQQQQQQHLSDDSLDRRLRKRSVSEAFPRRDPTCSTTKKFNTRRRS